MLKNKKNTISFATRLCFFDFARKRTLEKEEFQDFLDIAKRSGFNGLILYLEGFFAFSFLTGIVRKGCLTLEDAEWIRSETEKRGMELIPATNLVGHAESLLDREDLYDLRRDEEHDQLNLLSPKLFSFSRKIIDELIDAFQPQSLHIGGDEVSLDEQEREAYADFLSKTCQYISSREITPCLWGDMLYEHPDIAEKMDKNVVVYDWWYYGHRLESLHFFGEQGFKKVVACGCDQGWNGFIGSQVATCPWRPDKNAISVEPDESEAFLTDAVKAGLDSGLITAWENSHGRNLWSNMSAIVRAGLYMNGCDTGQRSIEQTLFGKNTPYTETSVLLAGLQRKIVDEAAEKTEDPLIAHCRLSSAVYEPERFIKLMLYASAFAGSLIEECDIVFAEAERLLSSWCPESSIEIRCMASLKASVEYGKTLTELFRLGTHTRARYHAASLVQFTDNARFLEMLGQVSNEFTMLLSRYDKYYAAQSEALEGCGQSKQDLDELKEMKILIESIARSIIQLAQSDFEIALPSWKSMLEEQGKC